MNFTKTPLKKDIKKKPRYPIPMVKGKYILDGDVKEKFVELFPKNSNRRMMQWFGLSFATLQRLKRELSLKRT